MVTDKRLRALYKAMMKETRGPATTNYILALMSKVDQLKMEVDALREKKE